MISTVCRDFLQIKQSSVRHSYNHKCISKEALATETEQHTFIYLEKQAVSHSFQAHTEKSEKGTDSCHG